MRYLIFLSLLIPQKAFSLSIDYFALPIPGVCNNASNALTWTGSAFGCNTITGGGGGSSSLGVYVGNVQISSPTGQIQFNANNFNGILASPSTAQINLNLVSLSTGVTGLLPAASIATGYLGNGVISSSINAQGINSSNQIVNGTIVGSDLANNTITNTQMSNAAYSNITGLGTQSQALNMGSNLIDNVTNPVSAQDAATKNYVDNTASGLDYKAAAIAGTTAALPPNIYSNGSSGVGATLTGISFGALSIDGYTPNQGDRVLVKNEAAQANNGIYTVTTVGSGIAVYVLTRATDYNQSSEIQGGDAVFVSSGTTLIGTGWVMTTDGTITVGTSPIVWSQFAGPGTITFQANGTNLTSQNSINFQNGSANSGITINMSNPSAGNVQASYSGNLTPSSIAAGSLGNSVIASSVAASGVGNSASYGTATQTPQITVNVDGRITSASNVTVTPAAGSITGGILGGTVIASSVAASGVGASATYGDSTHVGQFTVGVDGRLTAASNVAISASGGGGSSSLAVATGTLTQMGSPPGTFTSSPTAVVNLDANYFTSQQVQVSTSYISWANPISSNVFISANNGVGQWTSRSTMSFSGQLFFISSFTITGSTSTKNAITTITFSTYTLPGNTLQIGHSLTVECMFQNTVVNTGGSQIVSLNNGGSTNVSANATTALQWDRVREVLSLNTAGWVEPMGEGVQNTGTTSGSALTVTVAAGTQNAPWAFDATQDQTFYCQGIRTTGGSVNFLWMRVSIL